MNFNIGGKIKKISSLIRKNIGSSETFKSNPELTNVTGWTIGFISKRKTNNIETYQKDIEKEFKIINDKEVKAKIYDMTGIGGTYTVRFPQNLALGVNVYYNKAKDWTSITVGESLDNTEDFFVESLNTDKYDITFKCIHWTKIEKLL